MPKSPSPSKKNLKKLRNQIWSFLKEENYTPISQKKLFEALSIPKKDHRYATEIITEFLTKEMVEIKNSLILPKIEKKPETFEGKIFIHSKGFGFFTPDTPLKIGGDIFIPKSGINGAMDQDRVEVRIVSEGKDQKGPDGVVLHVLSRAREDIVALILEDNQSYYVGSCSLLSENQMIKIPYSKKAPLKVGDRVILKVLDWEGFPETSKVQVSKNLGSIFDASKDVIVAANEYNIKRDFSKEALAEAKKFSKDPAKSDLKGRLDLTKIETFTIDPDTARDFDDALSLTLDENKEYHLIVHVADVSHYVAENSALDKDALARANSTYFPGTCMPMLPEELSNGLCSLKEDVVRLTVSVFMHFDKKGNLKEYDIKKAFIKSNKRFTYKQAKQLLDGTLESPHLPTLQLMVDLAMLLQKKRHERGSVDLSMKEFILKLDDKGEPLGFEISEYDITHQLVEEFMLKANEIVAHSLLSRGSNALFRVHETPGASESNDFANLARSYGFKLKKNPTSKDVQNLFKEAKKTIYLRPLSIAFIRSMKLAIYSEQNVGHFGLSLEHYCHFTSPIRRYSDLIVHRILFERDMDGESLKKIALHCSEKERISFKAEQSVISLKKLRYLARVHDESPSKTYDAMVSKIKPYGLYFELTEEQIDGFIHVSSFGDEYFIYNSKNHSFTGEKSHTMYQSGTIVNLMIEHVDILSQKIEWKILTKNKKRKKEKNKSLDLDC